ncbi:nucleolin-like [Gossypium australe]|uniref:Nucleolin-like n=1 Tax=Gossypium australe TaxID=47621 RepID=A0A5B6UGY2_9ROSI|nr:nucleolin-like [Gossypium australe]
MEAVLADLTLNEDEEDVLQIQTDSNTVSEVEEYNLVGCFLTASNFLGSFLEYDGSTLGKGNMNFIRARVQLDIRSPLKRKKQVKFNNVCSFVRFKYERLTLFCFYCGRLRYSDSFCVSEMELGVEISEMGWDLSLRAQSRRALTMSSVWLREEGETSGVSNVIGSNTGHGGWEGIRRPGIMDPVLGFNPGSRSACPREEKESMMRGQSQTAMDHNLEDEVVVGEEGKKRARGDIEKSTKWEGSNSRSEIERHQLSAAAKGQVDRSQ